MHNKVKQCIFSCKGDCWTFMCSYIGQLNFPINWHYSVLTLHCEVQCNISNTSKSVSLRFFKHQELGWNNEVQPISWGVSWCCRSHCWLIFVLWCGYCSASFESFVLRHLVMTPSATPRNYHFFWLTLRCLVTWWNTLSNVHVWFSFSNWSLHKYWETRE